MSKNTVLMNKKTIFSGNTKAFTANGNSLGVVTSGIVSGIGGITSGISTGIGGVTSGISSGLNVITSARTGLIGELSILFSFFGSLQTDIELRPDQHVIDSIDTLPFEEWKADFSKKLGYNILNDSKISKLDSKKVFWKGNDPVVVELVLQQRRGLDNQAVASIPLHLSKHLVTNPSVQPSHSNIARIEIQGQVKQSLIVVYFPIPFVVRKYWKRPEIVEFRENIVFPDQAGTRDSVEEKIKSFIEDGKDLIRFLGHIQKLDQLAIQNKIFVPIVNIAKNFSFWSWFK
eukprot:gene18343-24034_t